MPSTLPISLLKVERKPLKLMAQRKKPREFGWFIVRPKALVRLPEFPIVWMIGIRAWHASVDGFCLRREGFGHDGYR